MQRWSRLLPVGVIAVISALALVSACGGGSDQAGQSSSTTQRTSSTTTAPGVVSPAVYFLALGDSVPVWNGHSSYPYQIAAHYGSTIPNLRVVDMACSGETSGSMLAGSNCPAGPQHSQLKEATSFLQAHQGSVGLLTIDIGGNDVVYCASGASLDVGCALRNLTTMQRNMRTILSDLRQAAGASVPIVGMNYYDPWLGDWLTGGSLRAFATGSVSLVTLFNQILAQVYGTSGFPVADVASSFHMTDLQNQVSSRWGTVPVAVERACTLLDIKCSMGKSEGFGDDPVTPGASVIAQAFEEVVGTSVSVPSTTTTTSPASSAISSPTA